MGCDIHLYVERNTGAKSRYGAVTWEHVPGCSWAEDPEYIEECQQRAKERGQEETYFTDDKKSKLPCFDPGRNYFLFAVLAGVRRGENGPVPILITKLVQNNEMPKSWSEMSVRGLPPSEDEDAGEMSDFVKARAYEYGQDGHSHSWLTLRELQEYPWDMAANQSGVVSVAEYIQYKEHGKPDGWCGSITGGAVLHVTNAEMDAYIAAGCPKDGKDRYTQLTWGVTPRTYCRDFVEKILPRLAAVDPNPDNVRICFFFDN